MSRAISRPRPPSGRGPNPHLSPAVLVFGQSRRPRLMIGDAEPAHFAHLGTRRGWTVGQRRITTRADNSARHHASWRQSGNATSAEMLQLMRIVHHVHDDVFPCSAFGWVGFGQLRQSLAPSECGPFALALERRFAPGIEQIKALLGLAVLAGVGRVHLQGPPLICDARILASSTRLSGRRFGCRCSNRATIHWRGRAGKRVQSRGHDHLLRQGHCLIT
jgi:hypothetical protein